MATRSLWLTGKQVRDEYQLTEKRLRRLREDHLITYKQEGNRFLHSRESLDDYFANGAIEAKPQIRYVERYTPILNKEVNSTVILRRGNLKGGKTMPKWVKEVSKDRRPTGRHRLNCGDFSLIEARGKGKTHFYMDYRDGDVRCTKSLKKLASRPIRDRAYAFETARNVRNRMYEESQSKSDKRDAKFSDFIPEYLNLIRNKRSYPTIENVVKARLEPFFGSCKFSELDLSMSSKYVEERRSEGDADGTIILHLSVFRRILNVASKFGYEVNAKKVISIADLELNSSRRERILESEEEKKLFTIANGFWKDLLAFALNTGLRLGNICHLKWTAVNFEAENITINGYESKNKKQFKIWMNPLVVNLLKRLRESNGEHDYVFMRNGNGHAKPLEERWIQREFKTLTEKAGIQDLHFHDLRRTFGCRLVDMGVDLLSIKEAMAHKTIEATLCYVRPNEDKVKDAFSQIGKYWAKSGVENRVKQ